MSDINQQIAELTARRKSIEGEAKALEKLADDESRSKAKGLRREWHKLGQQIADLNLALVIYGG